MNMTSATLLGAPGARNATCWRHLQEFSYKSKRNRSKLPTRGFSISLFTNMTSATVPGAPGAHVIHLPMSVADVIFVISNLENP